MNKLWTQNEIIVNVYNDKDVNYEKICKMHKKCRKEKSSVRLAQSLL